MLRRPVERQGQDSVVEPDDQVAVAGHRLLERYDMSLGAGLGRLAGRVFRIGHLGHFNDLTLAGTLAGVQLSLRGAGVPADEGGIKAALDRLAADE